MRIFMVEYVSADDPEREQYAYADSGAEAKMALYWPIIRDFQDGDTLVLSVDIHRMTIKAEVSED